MNIGAKGDIECGSCHSVKKIIEHVLVGPVKKVCLEAEVPYLAAIPLAVLMGAPIPGTLLIAIGSMGAFAVRTLQRLLGLYQNMGEIIKAKKAFEDKIKKDTNLPTMICAAASRVVS